MDEVNRNPDLLPNASLGFDLLEGDCKTVPQLYSLLHFPEGSLDIRPNYLCDEGSSCVLMLSGPTWTVSEIAGTYVNIYPFQTVRICIVGLQEILTCSSRELWSRELKWYHFLL